jgi:hypothetical protein
MYTGPPVPMRTDPPPQHHPGAPRCPPGVSHTLMMGGYNGVAHGINRRFPCVLGVPPGTERTRTLANSWEWKFALRDVSCTVTCKKHNMECDAAAIDRTEDLLSVFDEAGITCAEYGAEMGVDLPSVDGNRCNVPVLLEPPTCAGHHPRTRRVCPCYTPVYALEPPPFPQREILPPQPKTLPSPSVHPTRPETRASLVLYWELLFVTIGASFSVLTVIAALRDFRRRYGQRHLPCP